ncbi:uroporphyrinogen-III synthase [Sphingomonas jeddahensis]|uniref:Uroporphyrinogen-III synthase n=1 Tax=Sphingomonas jeddahensis TaxID=1915074 RepID=A0A1V2EUF5_9SPHN|nr:uroporphyrinogen-III synthase [Sphingomonas jeddahensis]ONF96127.1 uroporphyrinogen-III synthase [Sphingomonas jeddahensis]
MSRPALVLRPAPGDSATANRLHAAGLTAIRLPLFAVVPLPWTLPEGRPDALLLTSANAVRHAGAGLDRLRAMPVVAVGAGTAAAAAQAGLHVILTGSTDGAAAVALAQEQGWRRLLRLGGRERTPLAGVTDVAVYASEPLDLPLDALAAAQGSVVLLHSTRAARRFAELAGRDGIRRNEVRVAAISDAVAGAAGLGWDQIAIASRPRDDALVAAAATLAIDR